MKEVKVGRGTRIVIDNNNNIEVNGFGEITLVSNNKKIRFSNVEHLINCLNTSKISIRQPEKKEKIITICYGDETEWDSRKKALKHFFECMMMSEGSEHDRYVNIYTKLQGGLTVCSDDDY